MKVSIGSKIVRGPWGGGNLFAINLTNFLNERGHKVIYDLSEPDIDLILLTDPRSRGESSSTFNHEDIKQYKKYVNPNVAVVQRVNECDERKNTENINKFYLNASEVADKVIFVSSWLRNIYLNIGMPERKTSVILAGANNKIFNNQNLQTWDKKNKLKLVTHHWSSHKNKGFDIYSDIDNLLNNEYWKDKIEFTYIGNISGEYNFKNTKIVQPLAGIELANELKKHNVYVTGSINEPSGNHHIEAAQCGLPILYKDSGGIPEYCNGYGLAFKDNFIPQLEVIFDDYEIYLEKLKGYPFNSEKMCNEFLDLFEETINNKSNSSLNIVVNKYLKSLFLIRNKFLKLIRNIFSFNLRNQLATIVNRVFKR